MQTWPSRDKELVRTPWPLFRAQKACMNVNFTEEDYKRECLVLAQDKESTKLALPEGQLFNLGKECFTLCCLGAPAMCHVTHSEEVTTACKNLRMGQCIHKELIHDQGY